MLRIRIGMKQTYGNGLDAAFAQQHYEVGHFGFGERDQNVAFGIDAFQNFEGEIALHQRFGAMEEQVERLDAIAAPDRIDIAKALGRDERRARAFALEHRVDGDRRAVKNL